MFYIFFSFQATTNSQSVQHINVYHCLETVCREKQDCPRFMEFGSGMGRKISPNYPRFRQNVLILKPFEMFRGAEQGKKPWLWIWAMSPVGIAGWITVGIAGWTPVGIGSQEMTQGLATFIILTYSLVRIETI